MTRVTPESLLELPAQSEIPSVHLRKLLGRRVTVVQIPLELVIEFHRPDDDVELQTDMLSLHTLAFFT
jgi:hypothetical protein